MPVREIEIVFSFFRFFGLLRAKISLGSDTRQIYFLIYERIDVEKDSLLFDFQLDKLNGNFFLFLITIKFLHVKKYSCVHFKLFLKFFIDCVRFFLYFVVVIFFHINFF